MRMLYKHQIMTAFEEATKEWGLCYDKVEGEDGEPHYEDYITGTHFGMFRLGWAARDDADPDNMWMRTRC